MTEEVSQDKEGVENIYDEKGQKMNEICKRDPLRELLLSLSSQPALHDFRT